jgi:hypothetical protein
MSSVRTLTLLLLTAVLLYGCGKPNDPESIFNSGGYKIVTRYQTPANAQDLTIQDTLCYMAQGEGGLLILNIKNPAQPQFVSVTTDNVRGYSRRIVRKESFVYLAAGTFGFTGINISNPLNPIVTVSNLSMKPAKDAVIVDEYLFCATSEQGVSIAELSNPAIPDIRNFMRTNGYANGIAVNANKSLMFVACGEMGLSIFDISNFEEGFGTYPTLSWLDTPGYAEAVILVEEDSLALIAAGSSGLFVVDYSDLQNVRIVGSYSSGGSAYDLIYNNKRVYLTAQRGGLHILDITNPTTPRVLGRLDLKQAMGLEMDDTYIYVADNVDGLVVISKPQ